ncbi:MAG TPA: 50S ribosomal protein L9 [Thermomicrobiales bacterium]|jgi:large subunit ribosomal protein L9|nr:50S ribosomal protein L9 [Thermomicrobiales bacterium]
MKIVLREDVPKVGAKWDVVTVKDGYARNYLIPKGFATLATDGELKQVAEIQRVQARKIAKQEAQLQALSDRIDGQKLTFTARASADTGRLFGSITASDIAEKLQAQVGEEIDRRKVVLAEAIRSTGDHTVTVHLVGRLRPTITVTVEAEHVEGDETVGGTETATEAVKTFEG